MKVTDLIFSRLLPFAVWSWPSYQVAQHHRRIAAALERVERGEINRLIINMPPRHGKSMLASEYFPAWYLGRNPDRYVIHCTYAQDFADDMGRKVRNLMSQPAFESIFGVGIRADSSSARRFHTTESGVYVAVGAGGPITGRGAHLLLIDDPIKGRADAESQALRKRLKDWYGSVAYTRLMPNSAVVIIQTRWHEDDLSGWLLQEHPDEHWTVLNLPAIGDDGSALWPAAYPLGRLEQIRRAIGTRDFEALYQQRPSPGEGGIIKRGWWQYYSTRVSPERLEYVGFDELIQSWDLAFKDTSNSDFVCGQVWGRKGPDAWLLDQVCERMSFTGTIKAIRDMTARWPKARPILIEDKANGPAAMSVLRTEIAGIVPVDPGNASKESRVHAVTPMIEAGNVYLPSKALGLGWLDPFIEQSAAFPAGANDDMVDAMSQALGRLYRTRQSAGVAVAGGRRFNGG